MKSIWKFLQNPDVSLEKKIPSHTSPSEFLIRSTKSHINTKIHLHVKLGFKYLVGNKNQYFKYLSYFFPDSDAITWEQKEASLKVRCFSSWESPVISHTSPLEFLIRSALSFKLWIAFENLIGKRKWLSQLLHMIDLWLSILLLRCFSWEKRQSHAYPVEFLLQ